MTQILHYKTIITNVSSDRAYLLDILGEKKAPLKVPHFKPLRKKNYKKVQNMFCSMKIVITFAVDKDVTA